MSETPVREMIIGPQPGPQTQALASTADIVIYGGAAGGGKTYALLLEPLRHHDNPLFGGVIFRENTTQIRNEGGLWDTSETLYPYFQGEPLESRLEWGFPSGMRLKFAHLEHEKTVLDYQGAQIPFIGFDELTHFSEKQFFYLMSRSRSASGVPGYIRATCNPDPDSWVRKFIDWWIGDDGYAISERSGVVRWFLRRDDEIIWADTCEELKKKYGIDDPDVQPKSVTFIAAKLDDNQILVKKDPSYRASLLAMNRTDRLRLLGGNWNVRASAGSMFQREWFTIVDAVPAGWIAQARYWDRAATKPSDGNKSPDWTRGVKLLKYPDGSWLVADIKSMQDSPGRVEDLVKTTASHDGHNCTVWGEQDPGSAGVADRERFVTMLAGYDVRTARPSTDKLTRAKPVSAQCEVGNVSVMRAPWNDAFFSELENFPDGAHDDIVDAFSGAFNELSVGASILSVL